MVGGDLLDRLHGDPGLELGIMGAALAQLLRRRLRLRWEPPFRGSAPTRRLTMEAVQKRQATSLQGWYAALVWRCALGLA
jgi:hypothetical protein